MKLHFPVGNTCYLLLLILFCLLPESADAQMDWPYCDHTGPALPDMPTTQKKQATEISADHGEKTGTTYHLEGQVRIDQGDRRMTADRATYNEITGDLDASENVQYLHPPLILSGSSVKLNMHEEKGVVTDTTFMLTDHHARGVASQALLDGANHTVLKQVTYTTCMPGNSDWLLRASRVDLDHEAGFGSASHVRLSFMHIPFFYFPYMSFPISDKRKTGFLVPNLGHTNTSGSEIWLPYYINLAPNMDATVTPRLMSKRGNLFQGEFRYLTNRHHGTLDLEYLPDDRLYHDNRNLVHYRHTSLWSTNWSSHIDASEVSDSSYFSDLGNSLNTASITHLRQMADLQYQGSNWHGVLMLENYQTVDDTIAPASRPYKRLPLLQLGTNPYSGDGHVAYSLNTEYVHFSHTTRPTGDRLHIVPGIQFPFSTPAAFIVPGIKFDNTQYITEDPTDSSSISQERSIPVLTIDSGIFLERYTERYLQTLEPRLFYVYIPYRSQDDLPLFDTGTTDFTFNRLTAENRFSGLDRIGDTNHLSSIVTTRLINQETGRQRMKASIGQIYYFADRRLTLGSTPVETVTSSDVLAQTELAIGSHLSLVADLRWQNDWHTMERSSVGLHYAAPQRQIINVAYRYRRDQQEQDDISFSWPLSSRWQAVGSWTYSQQDKQVLESLAGLEYQDCCWALRMLSRRYLDTGINDYQDSVYIQLELKGLTNIGDKIETLLQNDIMGYY